MWKFLNFDEVPSSPRKRLPPCWERSAWRRIPARRGLYPTRVRPRTASPASRAVGLGAGADSFYEALLKRWLQSGGAEPRPLRMYRAALGGLTLALLRLHARRLRAAGAATPPFVTLQVLCGAALLFNGATLLHAAAGGCEGAGAATGAVVRFAAGLSTYTFRGGAALLALLMAHASCPERSMRARAEWVARAYRRGAAALAVVLVGSELTELVVSLVDAAAAGGGGGGGGGNLTLAAAAAAALANPGPAAPTPAVRPRGN